MRLSIPSSILCSTLSSTLFACLTALIPVQVASQITLGETLELESEVLEETRELWISTPESYSESAAGYPVVYLLDGTDNFLHTSAISQFLAKAERIPELIVVAIRNTDRGRDFTPPSDNANDQANFQSLGGAGAFQRFLKEELFPYIENNLNTHPYRVLIGHSLGGLFALHTLTSVPDLFDGYIAISPTLDWSNQVLVDQTSEFLAAQSELSIDLYLSKGNESGTTQAAFRKLTGVLAEFTPRDFRWDFSESPEEHHGSIPLPATYYGLLGIFSGWALNNPVEIYNIGGVAAMREVYEKSGKRFGYERSLPNITLLQLVNTLISENRLDAAAAVLLEDFTAVPPSYFLNLLANEYRQAGDETRAQALYQISLANNPTDEVASHGLAEMGIDTQAQRSDIISIEPGLLSEYTGEYRVTDDFILTIFIEDGELYQQGSSQRAAKLVALSENRFSVAGGDSQIEFRAAAGSDIDRLILSQFGREIEALKLP